MVIKRTFRSSAQPIGGNYYGSNRRLMGETEQHPMSSYYRTQVRNSHIGVFSVFSSLQTRSGH